MDIAWIGHAAFRLRGRDTAVVMDPAPSDTGFRLNRPQADIVTVSNPDPSYSWVKGVGGNPIPLDAPGEYEIQNVLVIGVTDAPPHPTEPTDPTDPTDAEPTPRAHPKANGATSPDTATRNIAFIVTIDELIIAHLGDMRTLPSGDALEELSRASVMLVPVGGHGHMDAAMAATLVTTVAPKIVIPMLYKIGPENEPLDPVAPFLKAIGGAMPNELDNHVNITRGSLPDNTTVHVLAPRGE